MQVLIGEPLFYIYIVYSLSFLIMSYLISYGILRATSVAFVTTFYMLAFFGLTHGIAEFIDWTRFILVTLGMGEVDILQYMSQSFMVVSFVFLLQFGVNLLTFRSEKKGIIRTIPFLLFVAYIVGLLVRGVGNVLEAGLLGRYTFGFASAALTAITLFNLSKTMKAIGNRKLVRGLFVAGIGFSCYAVFGGVIIKPIMGFPVQLFRAACAFLIAISFFSVLDVFKVEQ